MNKFTHKIFINPLDNKLVINLCVNESDLWGILSPPDEMTVRKLREKISEIEDYIKVHIDKNAQLKLATNNIEE